MNDSSEGTAVMAENESIGVVVALCKVGVCGSSLLILYSQWNGKQEEGIEDAGNLKKYTHLGKVNIEQGCHRLCNVQLQEVSFMQTVIQMPLLELCVQHGSPLWRA